jgi:hypothetical protein
MTSSKISQNIRDKVKVSAKNRCGYCLAPQRLIMARLEVEHIQPSAKGGKDEEDNLWLACPFCNSHKADKVDGLDSLTKKRETLFNPRTQNWSEHFQWDDSGTKIIGKTATGRATVEALWLDSDTDAIETRRAWVSVGWWPPKD